MKHRESWDYNGINHLPTGAGFFFRYDTLTTHCHCPPSSAEHLEMIGRSIVGGVVDPQILHLLDTAGALGVLPIVLAAGRWHQLKPGAKRPRTMCKCSHTRSCICPFLVSSWGHLRFFLESSEPLRNYCSQLYFHFRCSNTMVLVYNCIYIYMYMYILYPRIVKCMPRFLPFYPQLLPSQGHWCGANSPTSCHSHVPGDGGLPTPSPRPTSPRCGCDSLRALRGWPWPSCSQGCPGKIHGEGLVDPCRNPIFVQHSVGFRAIWVYPIYIYPIYIHQMVSQCIYIHQGRWSSNSLAAALQDLWEPSWIFRGHRGEKASGELHNSWSQEKIHN